MIEKLRSGMQQEGADHFLVTDSTNLSYVLSGNNGARGLEGSLIVSKEESLLLTSNFYRYYSLPQREQPTLKRKIYTDREEKDKIMSELELEGKLLTDATGEDYNELQEMFDRIERSQLLAKIRLTKERGEISKIKRACQLASKAMKRVQAALQAGMTEIELALVADKTIRQEGGDFDNAFPTLVQANALRPHRKPEEKEIGTEDVVIVDLGANYQGYCSDMTRVFSLAPNQKVKEVFSDVKSCYDLALENLQVGTTLSEVEQAVKDRFSQQGYNLDQNYLHSLGHGVGLEAHEPPFVRSRGKKQELSTLRQGMVVAIEPAVYLPEIGGIRIEDTILIKKDGKKEKLTSFPYRL